MPELRKKTRENASGYAHAFFFFRLILLNDFSRNLALKQWDPYIVTPVGIAVKYICKAMDRD
jgi:hypothetical protein